jgi:predicted RNA polymerase sigma factor
VRDAPVTYEDTQVESALTTVWRDEWGRLLALLVAQYRRLELAEDGLGDAFEAAARTWSRDGVPTNPAGWLLTAARRRVIDRIRAEEVVARKLPLLAVEADLQERAERVMADAGEVFDERLRLVLLCAHPALAPESAAALTLRLVLGVSTEDIARLFLVSTPTMAARLTRARKRLAGASFDLPAGDELVDRVATVATVAYLAFTAGYAPGSGADVLRADVAAEAIRLVRVLRSALTSTVGDHLPVAAAAELDALLALMLLQHARRDARVADSAGTPALVLLPDQDRSRWHQDEIAEALDLLTPHVLAPAAPYLLEALIAAEHAVAADAGATDWPRIATRYAELEQLTSSPVVRLNRAVAVAEADGPLAGLALLEGLELPGHRLPAARAELLVRAGRPGDARTCFARAIELCHNDAERAHLAARLAALD